MIVYEVTVMLDPDIEHDYRLWLEDHIRTVLKSPGFMGATLHTLLHQPRPSIVISYQVQDEAILEKYFKDIAPALRQEATERFGARFLAGRRILKVEKQIALGHA